MRHHHHLRNKRIRSRYFASSLVFVLISLFASSLLRAEGLKWLPPARAQLEGDTAAMPFYPSRAQTNNGTLERRQFTRAEVCATCHQEIYDQWKGSVMAHAWEDPIYRALLARASSATEGRTDNFCFGCHTPIGLTTRTAKVDPEQEEQLAPGVDCVSCHHISATTGEDNGAYVLSPIADAPPVMYGPRSDATSPFHASEYSALHTRSDFCGTCHNVTHPFSSVPIERTYDEWLESPYATEGIECQDCHMSPGPGVSLNPGQSALGGKSRQHVFSHHFTGGNVTLHNYFGLTEAAERARQMLRSAAALEWVALPDRLTAGQLVKVQLKVSNVGAGHKLPTGFPEGREVWVDFQVHDQQGSLLYRSGAVRDGATEPGTQSFKVLLGDKDGQVVDINVWEVTRILSDTRILPMGYAVVDYNFVLPTTVSGNVTLSADLNYWPFPQKIVDELLGPGKLQVEVVQMNTITQQLEVSAPASTLADSDKRQ